MIKTFSFALLLGIFINTPAQNSITFQTNLKEAINKNIFMPSSGDRIIVRGSFEGWNSNNYILSDDNADSIFSGVFNIRGDPKSVIEYKYVILKSDGKVIWESNPNPDNPPYGNRKLVLTGNPQLLSIEIFQLDSDILQNTGGKTIFSIKQLQNDFIELWQSLEHTHCCLYEYTNKEMFDGLFENQFKLINKPMEYHEFFSIVTPLMAKVGCMHTGIWMPNEF